jgi:hypothetical protein
MANENAGDSNGGDMAAGENMRRNETTAVNIQGKEISASQICSSSY